jgi:hypothetical protein
MTNLRLRFANAVLGVPRDESALPTFSEALRARTLSPEAFVAQVGRAKDSAAKPR